MKDPGTAILTAYYTALNGHTTLSVFTAVPPKTLFNYIWIGDLTLDEDSAKDRYITNATVAVHICKAYQNQGSQKGIEDEASTVMQHIRTALGKGLALTGYTMHVCTLDSSNAYDEITETDKIFHKVLRYRMIIEET